MRIDGPTSFSSIDRSSRPGSAATPLRDVQREQEQRREQPAVPGSTQGFETAPQARRVEATNASTDSLPARRQDVQVQRGLSSRASQALASYGSTASFAGAGEGDAQEILGLDLYA